VRRLAFACGQSWWNALSSVPKYILPFHPKTIELSHVLKRKPNNKILPPLAEQKLIVERLDSMRAKTSEMIAAYEAKLTAAKNLRQSIFEAAFAGDL